MSTGETIWYEGSLKDCVNRERELTVKLIEYASHLSELSKSATKIVISNTNERSESLDLTILVYWMNTGLSGISALAQLFTLAGNELRTVRSHEKHLSNNLSYTYRIEHAMFVDRQVDVSISPVFLRKEGRVIRVSFLVGNIRSSGDQESCKVPGAMIEVYCAATELSKMGRNLFRAAEKLDVELFRTLSI